MDALPIPYQEAETVANKLADKVFLRYLIPEQLHSDQRHQFELELLSEVCKLLNFPKIRTTHTICSVTVLLKDLTKLY